LRQRPIRVAVVGVGYFGQYHAKHYANNERAHLVAVVDINKERAEQSAAEFGAAPEFDFRQLKGRVDAVTVAVPTPLHYAVTRELLEAGIHVLVEKPIADNWSDSLALTDLAEQRNLVLQVGHIERCSASFRVLRSKITLPLYFESYRISPWRERGADVDVILDLMIHDIDIILGLASSTVTAVDAVGTRLFGDAADIANARINFQSGCVANVTASRVSHKTERSLRIFQQNSYQICDFVESRIMDFRLRGKPVELNPSTVISEAIAVPQQDSLANEIDEFLQCVAEGGRPTVDGRAGCEALRVANLIMTSIQQHHEKVESELGRKLGLPSLLS